VICAHFFGTTTLAPRPRASTPTFAPLQHNYRRLLDSNGLKPFTGCPFKQREMAVKSALACGLDWE
jgi:hypothetical protein